MIFIIFLIFSQHTQLFCLQIVLHCFTAADVSKSLHPSSQNLTYSVPSGPSGALKGRIFTHRGSTVFIKSPLSSSYAAGGVNWPAQGHHERISSRDVSFFCVLLNLSALFRDRVHAEIWRNVLTSWRPFSSCSGALSHVTWSSVADGVTRWHRIFSLFTSKTIQTFSCWFKSWS